MIRSAAFSSALCLALGLASCAHQRIEPQPIDAAAEQSRWLAGSTDDAALREALARHGVNVSVWPLPVWGLDALTAFALERHPDMAAARAEAAVAEAATVAARRREPIGIDLVGEHHSQTIGNASPWTLGVVFEMLVGGRARREAQADEADALRDAAVEDAAQTTWHVRQHVRDAYRELRLARQRTQAEEAVLQSRRALSRLWQTRLDLGAAAAHESSDARSREAEAQARALAAQHAVAAARQALAQAVGLPIERLQALAPAADADDEHPQPPPADALQRSALLDRIDVRVALARYAASEAALRVELARQWPELVLKPGFAWDQGDNRWSLGLATALPLGDRNAGPIAVAHARRDADAAAFRRLQSQAVAELDGALEALSAAKASSDAALLGRSSAQAARQASLRRLAAGDAGRLDVLAAEEAEAEAERALVDARAAYWEAFDRVEDAVQRPLETAGQAPTSAAAKAGRPA